LAARTEALGRRRAVAPRAVLLVASMAVFMAFLDDTVVGIAFPNMLRSFPQATVAELSWVFNGYNIAFAALLVPAGRLADLLGRRRMFGLGVVLFTVASGLCALAPSVGTLIGARVLQGAGAAIVVPASLALVIEAYPARERARAVGQWAATAALAAGIGPTIGGVLVDAYNWRLVFLINLPIGVLARYLAGRQLVESRAPGRRELPDLTGALVLAASVCALALAIAQGPVWGWTSVGVLAAAIAAGLGGFVFARRCLTHPAPVLDLELVRARGFAATSTLTLVGSAGFLTLGLANVLYLMQVWHYSPLTAGLALTPAPLVAAPTAVLAGQVAAKRDPRLLVVAGAVVLTAGAVWLDRRMGARPDYLGAYLPGAVLIAIGIGLAFPLVSDAAVADAPRNRFAGAIALNTAIRLIGAALGVAILAALIGDGAQLGLPSPFHRAWVFAAACFAALAPVALALPRGGPADLEDALERGPTRATRARGARPVGPAPPTARTRASDDPARPGATRAPDGPARSGAVATPANLLAAVPLFAGLSDELRCSLAARSQIVHLSAGEWLFQQGEQADALYVVRSGRLEVLQERALGKQEHDRERPLGEHEHVRELGPGSVVGELAPLSGARRSASVRCRRDAELLRLGRAELDGLLESTPGFAAGVSRALARQLQASRMLDSEPAGAASTIAVLALTPAAARAGVEPLLLRELGRLCRVARLDRATLLDRATARTLQGEAEPGVALARALDRLERDHELVLLFAGADEQAWAKACLAQADRTLLLISDPPSANGPGLEGLASCDVPPASGFRRAGLEGCDVLLLEPADGPGIAELLELLAPRSTQRVARASFEDDVARVARRLAHRSVGLVLSGGGARAFAQIGVIEELLAAGVVIDRVGGTSMGAFIGALLAQGLDAAEIDARCYEEWVRGSPLGDYRLPRHALLGGRRLRAMLERNLPGLIEDLPRCYYCISVDLIANELVVQRRGGLADAVAASMALPGVLPPVVAGQRLLVDGAVLDGLPVSVMAGEAEGPIIACDVTERKLRREPQGEAPRLPALIDMLANLAFLVTADTAEQAGRHADLLIVPDHDSVGALEFHMLDTLRDAGRRAAHEALEHAPAELWPG
jgi:NTE family protein